MRSRQYIFLFVCLLVLSSCKKDLDKAEQIDTIPYIESFEYLSGEMISANFSGRIGSVNPVLVSIGNKSTYTDQNGDFFLPEVEVDRLRAHIFVATEEHFNVNQVLIPSEQGFNYPLYYIPHANVISIMSTTSVSQNFQGANGSFSYSSNNIETSSGQAYEGPGKGYFYSLKATDDKFPKDVPGDMIATDASGDFKILLPYSYVAMRVVDGIGQELQLQPETDVQASFRIPYEMTSGAPETISIWRYDEPASVWREIATGDKSFSGTVYYTHLNQLGHYVAALSFDPVLVSGRILTDVTSFPVSHATIQFHTDEFTFRTVTTDESGHFSAWVPSSIPFWVQATSNTNDPLFNQFVGSIVSNTVLDDIMVEENLFGFVQGVYVDCNGIPLPGYIDISNYPGRYKYTVPENGHFKFSHSFNLNGFFLTALNSEFANPTDSVYVIMEEGHTASTGAHVSCDLPTEQFMIYQIDGSEALLVNESVSFESTLVNGLSILSYEFQGDPLGDSHNMVFESLDYDALVDGQDPLFSPAILTILNGVVLLGRFESSEDFEFHYLGISPISGASLMFEFEGIMNSTIGNLDITVSGIGVVKRP